MKVKYIILLFFGQFDMSWSHLEEWISTEKIPTLEWQIMIDNWFGKTQTTRFSAIYGQMTLGSTRKQTTQVTLNKQVSRIPSSMLPQTSSRLLPWFAKQILPTPTCFCSEFITAKETQPKIHMEITMLKTRVFK